MSFKGGELVSVARRFWLMEARAIELTKLNSGCFFSQLVSVGPLSLKVRAVSVVTSMYNYGPTVLANANEYGDGR